MIVQQIRHVISVNASPLSPRIWICSLDCGHDHLVTCETRFAGKRLVCGQCTAEVFDGKAAA